MENKIIINGVDVSGCKFAEISKMIRPNQKKPSVKCKILKDLNLQFHCICQYDSNCYYKQRQRKAEECEKYEGALDEIEKFAKENVELLEGYHLEQANCLTILEIINEAKE